MCAATQEQIWSSNWRIRARSGVGGAGLEQQLHKSSGPDLEQSLLKNEEQETVYIERFEGPRGSAKSGQSRPGLADFLSAICYRLLAIFGQHLVGHLAIFGWP